MDSFSRSSRTFLICSNAGKPLWSSRGDDIAQARLSSVVQALTARSSDALGGGENLSSMSVGGGVFIVFLCKGPLILLAASRTGETEAALRAQLKALHDQLLFSLTNKIHKRLIDRPGADVRPLLAGCDLPFRTLLRASSRSPALWLDAFPVLSLPSGMRSRALSALSTSGVGNDDGIVYIVLSAGYSIVAWTQSSDAYQFQPQDFFLLSSFLCSSASKCREGADAWTPICLPGLSEGAFVSAYVACLGLGIPSVSGGQRASNSASSSNGSVLIPELSSPKPALYNGDSIYVPKIIGESTTRQISASDENLQSSNALRNTSDSDINAQSDHISGISIVSPIPIPPPVGVLPGPAPQSLAPSAAFSPLGRLSFASPLALALSSAPLAPPYSAERSNRRFQIEGDKDETETILASAELSSMPSDLLERSKKHMDLSGFSSTSLIAHDVDEDDYENAGDESSTKIMNEANGVGEEGHREVEQRDDGEENDDNNEEDAQIMNKNLPMAALGGATPRVTRLARWAALSVASTSEDTAKATSNIMLSGEGSQPINRKIPSLPVPPSPWSPPPPYHPDRDGSASPLFLSIISTGSNSDHLESLASKRASIGRALLQRGLLDGILRAMECVDMETQSGGGTAPFTTSDAPASSYGVAGLVHFLYLWKPSRQYTMSLWPNEMLSASTGLASFKVSHRKRKALLRAYQRIYERLSAVSTPNVRHAASSFMGGSFDERGRFSSENSAASIIAHVAGVNTNQSVLLCSFDTAVDSTKVPVLSEKLLKALRRDHDRLFFQL